jgi:hypothetical protein
MGQGHSLKGRQDADAVDRAGLRLQLLKQQAAAGDIRRLFGDESEALTHPYLAHCWAKRGVDLRVEAPGQARKRALLGVLDNGPIHTSKATAQALAARPWLRVEWLPRCAPELNDIERSWRDFKRHYLAHQTFRDVRHLDTAIHAAVRDLNHERNPPMCAVIAEAA